MNLYLKSFREKEKIEGIALNATMAYSSFPDIWAWIYELPPISQWRKNSMSMCICSSTSPQPSLNLSITKNLQSTSLSLSILANFNMPVSLWTSKLYKINSKSGKVLDEKPLALLLANVISDVHNYRSSMNNSLPPIPKLGSTANFKEIFNFSFLALSFLICIYEAPLDLRSECLNILKKYLASSESREASKMLMRVLGSNLEEQWMRSMNLAVTNWAVELQATSETLKTPSPLFSYALSTVGLWKVQLYCPIIAMDIMNSSSSSADERLLFSLNYHQLEGVMQFNYKVVIREKWVDVRVNTDNIRFDVIRLVNEKLMAEQGVGASEKHFPSRICLQLTPTLQTDVLSISVGKSSENPTREIGVEKNIEGSFEPNSLLGIKVSAGKTVTVSLKSWKFEESVLGNSANLNWYLHDSANGREVVTSRPSKFALFHPKSWFKNRSSSAYRPFTRQGGIIFAGDEYGDTVCWKVDKSEIGKTMEWEIKGWIWLTYWPNNHRTFYNESKRLEFREILHITLA